MENLATIESIMIDYNREISSKRYQLEDNIDTFLSYRKYTNIGLIITAFAILTVAKNFDFALILALSVTLISYMSMHYHFYKKLTMYKNTLNNKIYFKDVKIEDKDIKKLLIHNDWTLEQMNKISICLKNKEMNYNDLMFLLEKTMNEDYYLKEIENYNLDNNPKANNVTNINDFEYSKNIILFRKMLRQKGIKIAI